MASALLDASFRFRAFTLGSLGRIGRIPRQCTREYLCGRPHKTTKLVSSSGRSAENYLDSNRGSVALPECLSNNTLVFGRTKLAVPNAPASDLKRRSGRRRYTRCSSWAGLGETASSGWRAAPRSRCRVRPAYSFLSTTMLLGGNYAATMRPGGRERWRSTKRSVVTHRHVDGVSGSLSTCTAPANPWLRSNSTDWLPRSLIR